MKHGEWLEYTIEVAEAGACGPGLLMGTRHDGRSVEIGFTRDGAASAYRSATIGTENTGGYASFAENAVPRVTLEAGLQTIRLAFDGDDQDLRALTLEPAAPETALSLEGAGRATVIDLAAGTRAETARLLPLGDSITYGTDTPGGWRAPLWDEFLDSVHPSADGDALFAGI